MKVLGKEGVRKRSATRTLSAILGRKEASTRSVEAGDALLVLVLLLSDSLLSLEECLSVLVELELSDHAIRGVNWDLRLLAYLKRSNNSD